MRYKCELVSFDLVEWLSENVRSTAPNADLNRILCNFDVSFTPNTCWLRLWLAIFREKKKSSSTVSTNCRLSKRLSLHCQNCNIWSMLLPDPRFAERESHNHFDAVSSWFHFLILFLLYAKYYLYVTWKVKK